MNVLSLFFFRKQNTTVQSYNFDAPGSNTNLQQMLQQQQLNVQLPQQQHHQQVGGYPQQQYVPHSPSQSVSLPTPLNKVIIFMTN